LCTTTPADVPGNLVVLRDDLPRLARGDGTPVEVPDHVGLTAGHDRVCSSGQPGGDDTDGLGVMRVAVAR